MQMRIQTPPFLKQRAEASQPMDYIDYEQAAELDRLDVITGEVAEDKNNFIFRDSRTGRPVVPHKAGKPGTLRSELRTKPVRIFLIVAVVSMRRAFRVAFSV